MAYTGNSNNKFARPAAVAASSSSGTGTSKKALYRTGLFTPTREGSKAMAGVQVKEDVVIKAGSYINIYHNEAGSLTKNGKPAPDFTMTVTEGQLKSK